MKITYTILMVFLVAVCVFGQKRPSTSTTKKSSTQQTAVTACSKLFLEVKDKFSGETKSISKITTLATKNGQGFKTDWAKVEDQDKKRSSLVLLFTVVNGNRKVCLPEFAKVMVLFSDGEKKTLSSNAGFNCDNKVMVYFGSGARGKAELGSLRTKLIETIRIYTSESYVEMDLTPAQAKKFIAELNCLFGEYE